MKKFEKVIILTERLNMALAMGILVAFAVNFVIRVF